MPVDCSTSTHDDQIIAWLSSIQDYSHSSSGTSTNHQPLKRRRGSSPKPTTRRDRDININITTHCVDVMPTLTPHTPQSKRQKLTTTARRHTPQQPSAGGDNDDVDPTPRAAARKTPSLASSRETKTTASSSSYASGTSSPAKHFRAIALQQDGIERRILEKAAHGMPDQLTLLLRDLENVANGIGIISTEHKSSIETQAAADPTLPSFPSYMFDATTARESLGPTPPLEAVLGMARWAKHCIKTDAHEDTWNAYVHFPLLCLAVYGSYHQKSQLMNVEMCTRADIIQEYRHLPIPSKRVDFVLHCSPSLSGDGATASAIDRVRESRPLLSINHTDLSCLISSPICTSIETKRQYGDGHKAELQIGVWHAAQWKMLSQITRPKAEACAFLPGVIISGHEWRFIATTVEGGQKTVLWTDYLFGSSSDAVGIYKIIHGIQYLLRDGRERYWPWFRENALAHSTLSGQNATSYTVEAAKRIGQLSGVADAVRQWDEAHASLSELQHLLADPVSCSDAELRQLATGEMATIRGSLIPELARRLASALIPPHPFAPHGCLLELHPGAGGSEASLFAHELLHMYMAYCAERGLPHALQAYEADGEAVGGQSGLTHAILAVTAPAAYDRFRSEAGVHRVQRVPATEKKGRTHTSAVSANDYNDPNSDYYIAPSDVRSETMRARGAGGQHVNKTDSAVRLTHIPTGIVVAMQEDRSQHKNRERAWALLRAKIAARKREEREAEIVALRRKAMGGVARTGREDKVRTYNFSQNRVTDHRSGWEGSDLEDILAGGNALDSLMASVRDWMDENELREHGILAPRPIRPQDV
ncbi:hypothetical protein DV738_g1463, partial [Chaetothyriales sp. CBS 135597]